MFNLLHRPPQTPQEKEQPRTCKHSWELFAKTFAEPVKPIDPNADPKLIFGVTTLIWNCSACGEFNKVEMLGSDENRWNKIVENVDKHGMQYIKEGNKVYGVAEWVPETTAK